MKQRIITACLMFVVLIPIFYLKWQEITAIPLYLLALILVIVATTEIISAKEFERRLPFIVRFLMYVAILYLGFNELLKVEWDVEHTLKILPLVFLILATALIFERDFKLPDAGFVFFTIFYLGLSFAGLMGLFIADLNQFFYILMIAVLTDTFAYFTGYFFGKHKLAPTISPKKTIEGAIGGTVIAVILASLFAYFVMDKTDVFPLIGITLLLSVMGQIGDLFASIIKRHFGIKDYGNLFPGHGGVLDRLDSVLMIALTYSYLLIVLTDVFNYQF